MTFDFTASSGQHFDIELKGTHSIMHFAIWSKPQGLYHGYYAPQSVLKSDFFWSTIDDKTRQEIAEFCDKIIANRMFI